MKRYVSSLFSLCIFTHSIWAQTVTPQQAELHRNPSQSSVLLNPAYSIRHYDISIDTIAYASHTIRAVTSLKIVAGVSMVSNIDLDLQGFTVDSVIALGQSVSFTHLSPTLSIQLNPGIAAGDSLIIQVHYQGAPAQDASGWGGFYFSGAYAFNLGVGFASDPHNFGKAWFPCEDNFTSKARYDFHIRTDSTSKAFCNGTLQSSVPHPDGTITWNWSIQQPIATYLASVAVAPYYTLQRTSNGLPVEWATLPADTNLVLGTFSNLDTAIQSFITAYGPYPFDKVGYCLVPFNSGAMEHATSIHIGRSFVDGTQANATLWAHELSHMWWGDKVTCSSAQDMWLNEGFASFNEAYFTEKVSGETAYRDWIRSNHRKVLQFAHTPAQDGSYLTLNNIPHDYTYGFHVYQKGASTVHTLRNYMGDSAFFAGCRSYMNNRAYGNASSYDLRDELNAGAGVNVSRFFDDWVLTPGFPNFSIDSVVYFPGGLDHYFIYTRQRTKGNNGHLYEMPIEINFSNGIIDTTVKVVIDSATNVFHIPIYFMASMITLDRFGKICDARVCNEKTITATGLQVVAETGVSLNVTSVGAPGSLVRIEHHFVAPDPFINSNPGIRISDYRYWKVDGMFHSGFNTKGTFTYDGSTSSSSGYLDNTLIAGVEDSIVMLYREAPGSNWALVPFTINYIGGHTDKRGTITVDSLRKGEYALGYYDFSAGISAPAIQLKRKVTVFPNPSQNVFTIEIAGLTSGAVLKIIDLGGREIYTEKLNPGETRTHWDSSKFPSGTYRIMIMEKGKCSGVGSAIKH